MGKVSTVDIEAACYRMQLIMLERFGIQGREMVALQMGIPIASLRNYMNKIEMPGSLMLQFLQVTGARPEYLLTGQGEMFQAP